MKIIDAPLVSIVIPTYNKAQYICETIESAIHQTYPNVEIIVVDDGSEDNTRDVLDAYIKEKKITYYYQNNSGPASARNNGISLADGKYILCLDSDDILDPSYLEKSVPILQQKEDVGVVYTWVKTFGTKEEIWKCTEFDLLKILTRNQVIVTALFRRVIWETSGGFDTEIIGAEDWEFWIKTALAGWKFHCIPEILFYYRKLPVSRTTESHKNYYLRAGYIRHKHKNVYSINLSYLLSKKPFGNISNLRYIKFWLYNIFYFYVPKFLQKRLYYIHKKLTR